MAVVSAERQFDSHYLEEHLDLDLKEQQRGSNKTGYARIPTHEAALIDHCRYDHQKLQRAKPTEIMSDVGTEVRGIS